jgi:hypothetical protein
MQKAMRRYRNHEREEQRQGVQPIGNVLIELFTQYRKRYPHLEMVVISSQRPSETERR